MQEIMILLGAATISFLVALLKTVRFSSVRQQTLAGMVNFKIIILLAALFGVLFGTHEFWVGLGLSFVFLLLAQVVAARGWLAGLANFVASKSETFIKPYAKSLAPVFNWLARPERAQPVAVSSKAELQQIIESDGAGLDQSEKQRLLASLDFANKKIGDFMVPSQSIKTVDIDETVGPLLLDKLHKFGHNIYPVAKKDLTDVKGFLYMSDLVPLDPDLKDVAEALRPKVHYLQADAGLEEVIANSLKTGRQLFLVKQNDKVVGLITLADALAQLNGQRFVKG